MSSPVHIDKRKIGTLTMGKGLADDVDDTKLTAAKEYLILMLIIF